LLLLIRRFLTEGYGCEESNNFCPLYDYRALAPTFNDYPGTNNCEACADFTCQNGGTCIGEQNELFLCECASGFGGANCELEQEGGICAFGNSVPTGCSCLSGYIGEACDIEQGGSCLPLPTVPPLSTEIVAEFMQSQSSISSDALSFMIQSPGRAGRYFESISLNDVPECSYPGPHFVKGFEEGTCEDSFTASFLIPELVQNCSFSETLEATALKLEGKVHVRAIDPLGDFRGTSVSRSTHSVLTLNLLLPTTLTLSSSNLTVDGGVELLIAITKQEYQYEGDVLVLELTASVPWPYQLENPFFLGNFSSAIVLSSNITKVDCSVGPDTDCLQIISFELSGVRTLASQCDFDGDYQVEMEAVCRSGAPSCFLSQPIPLLTNFTLMTGDFCGSFSVDAALSGTLKSFSDSSFLVESVSFVAGRRLYFKVSLDADVSILDVQIMEIQVVQEGDRKIVVQDGAVTPQFLASSLNYVGDEAGTMANEVGFSFVALYGDSASDIFDSSGAQTFFPFTVEVTVQVTYQTSFTKRDILNELFRLKNNMILLRN